MPHNLIAHSLSEYGLIGGGAWLAMVLGMLAAICRPGRERGDGRLVSSRRLKTLSTAVGLALTVTIFRAVFGALPVRLADVIAAFDGSSAGCFDALFAAVYELALPAGAIVVAVLLAGWGGMELTTGPARLSRLLAGCALGGFVLQNMVEDSLWFAGPAGVFWLTAGACVGQAGCGRVIRIVPGRRLVALAGWTGVVLAGWWLVLPVARQVYWTERAIAQGGWESLESPGRRCILAAVEADPLNPNPPADAAMAMLAISPLGDMDIFANIDLANELAHQACLRDRQSSALARLAARTSLTLVLPDTWIYSWQRIASSGLVQDQSDQKLAQQGDELLFVNEQACRQYVMGDYQRAVELARWAAELDGLSIQLQLNLAQAAWSAGDLALARQAWSRSAELAGGIDLSQVLAMMDRAVELNPVQAQLRIDRAQMLLLAGKSRPALAELDHALWLDRQLPAESVYRLDEVEMRRWHMLKAQAEFLAGLSAESDGE